MLFSDVQFGHLRVYRRRTVTPLSRIVNVYDYLDYISNRVLPDFSMEVKRALEGLWSSSSVPGSQKSPDQFALSCKSCGTLGNLVLMTSRKTC